MTVLPWLDRAGAGWPDPVKVAAAIGLLAPLAFAMGIPFPAMLGRLAVRAPDLLAWAWGINGCTSVVGAILATVIAVHGGFRVLVLAAGMLYGCAVVAWYRLGGCGGSPGKLDS